MQPSLRIHGTRSAPARGRNLERPLGTVLALAFCLALSACDGDDGSDGATGPVGPPGPSGDALTPTDLEQGDDLPGLNVAVTGVSGGSGPGGRFLPGDTLRLDFTLQKDDGSTWDIAELSLGRALVSGPTFNYQRVLAQVEDVRAASVQREDGSYRYTFALPIPETYLAPLNDSDSFDEADGELTGEPLLDGTYTAGLYFRWSYTLDGEGDTDAGDATYDFVIGSSGSVDPREVVRQENCNRCHSDLQAHGGSRHSVNLCLLCHTAGAEDRNVEDVLDGSPGVSIAFKTMVHKIHSGGHLPSVLGVGTNPDGTRTYAAEPRAYQLVGHNDSIEDFSEVAFPAWPHGLVATPRDQGYTALSTTAKALEDRIRTGPSNCVVCHGDPDGDSGPLTEPAQGSLAFAQPSRASCGACHDDVNWGQPYTANGQTMPSTANDSNCILCHPATGVPEPGLLPTDLAHLHPMLDPSFDSGTVVLVESLSESGDDDGDGTVDPGEKIQVIFRLQDDAGTDLLTSSVSNLSAVISGPTSNYNLVLNATLPTAALSGAQPYTVQVPMLVQLERLGVSTGTTGDEFTSAYTPHWNVSGASTSVLVRTATSTETALAEDTVAPQNYIDVDSVAGLARNDYVVIDDGEAEEEYVQVQNVIGNRLWFSSPYTTGYKAGLRLAHSAGATVKEVTLTAKTAGTDYTLVAADGEITEVIEFGDGNVVVANYTTDFVMPETFPLTLNDSPDLDEASGEWAGKPIVDGTYSLSLWTSRTLTLSLYGETNSYRSTADAELTDFLVGDATEEEPYALISSGDNCYNCHQDVAFHGAGRRTFDACVICHGAAGAEDRPRYVAGNAPATDEVSVSFRSMLHKIHMGEHLTNASSWTVVGFGSSAFPNNYTPHNYGEVLFPAMPGGVSNCSKCHGDSNTAWHEPALRNHPTDQGAPVRRWSVVCGACHDSDDALAHIEVQTSGTGQESCGVCHAPGKEWSVEKVHKTY